MSAPLPAATPGAALGPSAVDGAAAAHTQLPSPRELERRFGFVGAGVQGAQHEPEPSAGGSVRCACAHCAAWAEFIARGAPDGSRQYEVFTRTLVAGLASALLALRAALRDELPDGRELRVLELGAGSGRLAHLLREELALRAPAGDDVGVCLIASDIAQPMAKQSSARRDYPVLHADHRQALLRCSPDVVLACWMPLGADWTAVIRQTHTVHAFVLVGDTTGALCGDPVKTWARARRGTSADANAAVLPARLNGWAVRELAALSAAQLCMADEPWLCARHSRTVLVVREERVLSGRAARALLAPLLGPLASPDGS